MATLGGAMASACGAAATVALPPNQVRAQATAVYWVIINLAGLFIGPPLVGLLTDRVFSDPAALKSGLAIVPMLVGTPLIFVQFKALTAYRVEMMRFARPPKLVLLPSALGVSMTLAGHLHLDCEIHHILEWIGGGLDL